MDGRELDYWYLFDFMYLNNNFTVRQGYMLPEKAPNDPVKGDVSKSTFDVFFECF